MHNSVSEGVKRWRSDVVEGERDRAVILGIGGMTVRGLRREETVVPFVRVPLVGWEEVPLG